MEKEFRVWCKDKNDWESHGTCVRSDGQILHLDNGKIMPLRPDTHIVQFFTGMIDKNGKRIWEGSNCKVTRACVLVYGSIIFENGAFVFKDKHTDSRILLYSLASNNYEIEVLEA